MSVRVLSGAEAAELDATAIAGGHPSRELMQAAGEAAAQLITGRFPLEIARGVAASPSSQGTGTTVATRGSSPVRSQRAEFVCACMKHRR
jgi:hypothetical protein